MALSPTHSGPETTRAFSGPPQRRTPVGRGSLAYGGAPVFKTVLTTAVVAVLLCGGVWLYASSVRPDSTDRIILTALLAVPAAYFAITRSSLLLDHFLIVVVVNRLLRRLMDWGEGRYDVLPLLSLVPILIAGLMLVSVWQNWRRLPATMRRACFMLGPGVGYGLLVGLSGYGLSAAYACAEYVTPLIVMYYCVTRRPSEAVLHRWLTVLATLGVLSAAYGIVQWFDVPNWDAAWLMWSGMYSSQGSATAFGMSIMSTLESRGPAAQFFATVVAIFVALPFLRRRGGVLLGVLPLVALMLTTARTGLIFLCLSLLVSAVLSRGRAGAKIILAMLFIAAGATFLLGRQSESEKIFDRVATLGDLSNDGSATGRVGIARFGVVTLLTNPQGFGFGSGGTSAKVGATEADAVGDNGYLEILTTLGIPGATLYFGGLLMIVVKAFRDRAKPTGEEPTTTLGLGILLALVPVLIVGNCLITAHASYVWIILSRHLASLRRPVVVRRPARPDAGRQRVGAEPSGG